MITISSPPRMSCPCEENIPRGIVKTATNQNGYRAKVNV